MWEKNESEPQNSKFHSRQFKLGVFCIQLSGMTPLWRAAILDFFKWQYCRSFYTNDSPLAR